MGSLIEFISKTDVLSSQNSGDININSNRKYLINFFLEGKGTDATIKIRFNSDDGEHYKTYHSIDGANSSADGIALHLNGDYAISGEFFINKEADDNKVYINGTCFYFDSSDNPRSATFGGVWDNSEAPNSFEIVASQNADMSIILNRLNSHLHYSA